MADPKTIYRLMLKLYPARFREEYETPLERQFWDEYRELPNSRARAWFWACALADLAISIPAEFVRELRQDIAYAARVYRRRSVATGLALVALALAIGATTGVFSVVNAVLLRGLPFHDPERLVQLQSFSLPDPNDSTFRAWHAAASYLAGAAVYRTEEMNFSTTQDARRIRVAETSANFFAVLGAEPQIGRAFADGEDSKAQDNVAVIGYGLWQQFFGGDPRTLGSIIHLNGTPMTVVGIAPLGFDYPAAPGFDYPGATAVWTPTVFDVGHISKARAIWWNGLGRLKPGITLAHASSLYRADILRQYRKAPSAEDVSKMRLISLRDQLAGPVRTASLALLGVVVFVLLTACANVAHLLLARVAERGQELVLRAALGASRARLVQQLITEATLLTVAAATAGTAVAYWASRLAETAQPAGLAAQAYTILDWRVFGFAVALASLTGLLFGVIPASLIGRIEASADSLRAQPGAHAYGVSRLRGVLIALQTALTLVLVAGSITMGRGFLKLMGSDLGYKTDHVVTMSVALSGTLREQQAEAYYREVLERLRSIPGVESAGSADYLPLVPNAFASFPFKLNYEQHFGNPVEVTAGYFRAMGTEILRGRDFTSEDEMSGQPVVIVNEAFARQFDRGLEMAGRNLTPPWIRQGSMQVVGVARSMRYSGPARDTWAQVFWLPGKNPNWNRTFVARVHGDAEAYLPICRDAIRSVDPRVPVFRVSTLGAILTESLAKSRFYTTVVLFFGAFALLLAVIGIYGVASHSIAQRTHELGVRLAVGASSERLRAMLLRQSLLPGGGGLVLGIAGALALGRMVEHLMDTADPIRVPMCAAAALLLAMTASLTVWTATRRIVRMDPMSILRAE